MDGLRIADSIGIVKGSPRQGKYLDYSMFIFPIEEPQLLFRSMEESKIREYFQRQGSPDLIG